jgi:hypothetical protein
VSRTTNQGNDKASFNDEASVEDDALTDRGALQPYRIDLHSMVNLFENTM